MQEDDVSCTKLSAMADLTDARTVHDLEILIRHSDDFAFEEDIQNDSDAGYYFTENFEDFAIADVMQEYFDFAGFGRQMMFQYGGKIVGNNLIYYCGLGQLQDITNRFDSRPDEPILQL